MLDDIYPRLLLELIPSELKLSSLDIQRTIESYNRGSSGKVVYGELIKSIYKEQADSDIGIRFGEQLIPSTLCDFSRVLISAQNIKSALEVLSHSYYILGTSYYPMVSYRKGIASLSIIFPYKAHVNRLQKQFCAEAGFSYLINAIRESVDPTFTPAKVYLEHARPHYADKYTSLFGENIQFNAPLNYIEFDENILFRTLKGANSTLHHLYMNKCMDGLRNNDKLIDFEHKAVSFLLLHHPESFNSQKLATKLNISVRGLQKKLGKYDSSFSLISHLARRELAKVYLIQEQQSIDYTAEQLGFQTNSGFRRFFKAEFDCSPVEYQNKLNKPNINT